MAAVKHLHSTAFKSPACPSRGRFCLAVWSAPSLDFALVGVGCSAGSFAATPHDLRSAVLNFNQVPHTPLGTQITGCLMSSTTRPVGYADYVYRSRIRPPLSDSDAGGAENLAAGQAPNA